MRYLVDYIWSDMDDALGAGGEVEVEAESEAEAAAAARKNIEDNHPAYDVRIHPQLVVRARAVEGGQ